MTLTTDDFKALNTIYIISKGRPGCLTAQTLTKMNYPGAWFIVCGNNDETLPEYIKNWGKERILVFDWYEEITRTDTLDNFGFDKMPSGAVPVRNATIRISKERGERRHWQFDDDYRAFYLTNLDRKKHDRLDGRGLQWWMCRIAKFADSCGLPNCGFALGTIESAGENATDIGTRVFNAHNQSSTGLATRWRSRLNDDLVNAIETHRLGQKTEYTFLFMQLVMPPSQQEKGGLSDIYLAEGTVRKSAYPILLAPNAAKLVIKFGRYHHKVDWSKIRSKVISEKWRKE